MPALSWLMNLGFAAGGAVVTYIKRIAHRRWIKSSSFVGDDRLHTAFVRKNEELCYKAEELVWPSR